MTGRSARGTNTSDTFSLSGVTAATLALALERIGHRNWSLYDGSWSEWGSFPDLRIATGDA